MIYDDLFRYTKTRNFWNLILLMRKNKGFAFLVYWRLKKQKRFFLFQLFFKFRLHSIGKVHGLEIPLTVSLGNGVCLIHPYNITINSKAVIGKNLTILKGATIGNTKGKNGGVPVIGDNVYIGLNASVVGNIKVGNNVLIAANSFVNFDVPSNSVVIGNPGVIHLKENPTENYILNPINRKE